MENKEDSELRNAAKTMMFYGVATLIIILINISGLFKSGPCSPNLDVLSVFFIGPISFILFLWNLYLRVLSKRLTLYSLLIHLVVFGGWVGFTLALDKDVVKASPSNEYHYWFLNRPFLAHTVIKIPYLAIPLGLVLYRSPIKKAVQNLNGFIVLKYYQLTTYQKSERVNYLNS
jgi:hypothetical protein